MLIHSADPQSRPVGIIVSEHVVHFSKSSKAKQSENNAHYWRDCWYGRVDH